MAGVVSSRSGGGFLTGACLAAAGWALCVVSERPPIVPIVIVALLAAGAFVVFRSLGGDALQRNRLEHDLGMLFLAQGEHHRRFHVYAPRLGRTDTDSTVAVLPDSGNAVVILHADSNGFAATATTPHLVGARHTCGIYGGAGPSPHESLTEPGKVACW